MRPLLKLKFITYNLIVAALNYFTMVCNTYAGFDEFYRGHKDLRGQFYT